MAKEPDKKLMEFWYINEDEVDQAIASLIKFEEERGITLMQCSWSFEKIIRDSSIGMSNNKAKAIIAILYYRGYFEDIICEFKTNSPDDLKNMLIEVDR